MPRYIDADALMNELRSMVKYENDGAVDCGSYNTAIIDAKAAISSAPTLSPDEVRGVGEWIEVEQPMGWRDEPCAECSVCGEDFVLGGLDMEFIRNLLRYCPNCGAKMKGADDGKTD